MTIPLVSWLMPVYNAEKHLRRALDSMLHQTYQQFELVIMVEYGCTDCTEAICREYSQRDKRIRIFVNEEKLGIARSLNSGLDRCKGKYIARMDADDVSHPDRLEKQVLFMEENGDVAILGSWSRVIRDNGPESTCEHPTDYEMIRAELLLRDVISHPTVMLRAEIFHNNNWKYPEEEAEDYALWAKLISKVKFRNLPEVLLDYYQHDESASSIKFMEVRKMSAVISRRAILSELGIDTSAYSDFFFGWRGHHDNPTCDHVIEKILIEGAKLVCEIKSANDHLQKFEESALSSALQRHWQKTKELAHMGFLTINYDSICKESNSISPFMNMLSDRVRVLIYGTGSYCKNILSDTTNELFFDIVAFCDSDANKQGDFFFGKNIIAPEEITNVDYDYIFIAAPLYEKEIRNRLINEFHIPYNKIFNLPSVSDLIFLNGQRERKGNKIV